VNRITESVVRTIIPSPVAVAVAIEQVRVLIATTDEVTFVILVPFAFIDAFNVGASILSQKLQIV
jgi:hypothetical protein